MAQRFTAEQVLDAIKYYCLLSLLLDDGYGEKKAVNDHIEDIEDDSFENIEIVNISHILNVVGNE